MWEIFCKFEALEKSFETYIHSSNCVCTVTAVNVEQVLKTMKSCWQYTGKVTLHRNCLNVVIAANGLQSLQSLCDIAEFTV